MLDWERLADEARELARGHLARYADPQAARTDLEGVASGLGITIVSQPFHGDPCFTGEAVWDDGTFRLVIVNSLLPRPRCAFTVAHEIAHIVLGHWPPRRPEQERLANVYASELLMPGERLLSQIEQYGGEPWLLAGINGVSLAAMRLRLEELQGRTNGKV